MTAYLLVLILAVGIPFLLYCLWNFARELRPHRSGALVSSRVTSSNTLWTIPATHVRNRPQIVSLRNESRAAS
jgi:heme/copper-type cytochrome/quinol oxidase subunit 2